MPLPNLGQPPALSSVHPGLYQHPHWSGSGHRLLACPQGSGPLPLLLSLPFLLGKPTPVYPGLKTRTFASAPPARLARTLPLTQALSSCTLAGGDSSQRP